MVKGTHMNRDLARIAKAFTLIELLLVLVILGVLAAYVVPKFTNRTQDAKITRTKADITTIKGQIAQFEIDCSRFPTNEEALAVLLEQPGNAKDWKGPYLEQVPTDPWGHPYLYRYPGQHNPRSFDVYSMGPDQQEGTADDIGNW
jgi:general secretion pathway protein G